MLNPTVSVIVPVYNAAETLTRSISSLLRQHFSDIEIILVDDASCDSSASVMRRLAKGDARIKMVFKPVNEGTHEARRSGLEVATGNWIGFMDADDHVEPQMYSQMLNAAKVNEPDIVICGVDRVAQSGHRVGIKLRFREETNVTDQVFERFCRHEFGTGSLCNKLYRRELIMENGLRKFRWRQDINEDTLVNIGCFLKAQSVTVLSDICYHYLVRCDSASAANNTPEAVTNMLRGYGLAVELYVHYGSEIMKHIDSLYRDQLSYPCYFLEDPSAIYKHGRDLSEVLGILSSHHPAGFGVLVGYLGRPRRNSSASFMENWRDWRRSTKALSTSFASALLAKISRGLRKR